MPHKVGDKNIKTNRTLGSKDLKNTKTNGIKDDYFIIDKRKLFNEMYGPPIIKGSKEHKDFLRSMFEDTMLQSGNVLEEAPPAQYLDDDFSVPDGTNVSFFT